MSESNGCRWENDVECPYASGFEICKDIEDEEIEEIECYEEDTRPHPLDNGDRGDYLYEQWKDRKMLDDE